MLQEFRCKVTVVGEEIKWKIKHYAINTRQWQNGTELDQLKFPSVIKNIFKISPSYVQPTSDYSVCCLTGASSPPWWVTDHNLVDRIW